MAETIEITQKEVNAEPGCGMSQKARILARKLGKRVFVLDYIWNDDSSCTVTYQLRKPAKHVTFREGKPVRVQHEQNILVQSALDTK